MTRSTAELPRSSGSGGATVAQAVTVIMGIVVGLTFRFGFDNVLNLGLRLGIPVWGAPLVAQAVDLSVLGLRLGIRQLALAGATLAQLRPARRLLIFASTVALALNVADPLLAGQYGKAVFNVVGPLLLIGWAEVGPDLLRALTITLQPGDATLGDAKRCRPPSQAIRLLSGRRRRSRPARTPSPRAPQRASSAAVMLPTWLTTICWRKRGQPMRVIGTSIAGRSPLTHCAEAPHWRRPLPTDRLDWFGPIPNNDQLQTRWQPALRAKSDDRLSPRSL
ncbi:hypothetical protein [Amycolatopsis regifaucium]|uniref:hypothetical protein n=1 Tax=Amycolatopsis regifaucium TaxID=546365 RepID=UPI0008F61871|nr:hypothetical protein [Amycolatopsis regifaucium]SFI05978.1 hypothetical protein SAMN04489731_10829 [Amycolatopsis regifaucium]